MVIIWRRASPAGNHFRITAFNRGFPSFSCFRERGSLHIFTFTITIAYLLPSCATVANPCLVSSVQLDVQFLNEFLGLLHLEVHDGIKDLNRNACVCERATVTYI